MNVDVGDYCCAEDGRLPLSVVDADRLMVGGPMDGHTIRFREGNEPNGDGSFRVVRVDRIEGFDGGRYEREWLSPAVVVYRWHEVD